MKLKVAHCVWVPLLSFVLYLPFSSHIDIRVASFFAGPHQRFRPPAWTWKAYRYGLRPGQILFISSGMITLAYALRRHRPFAASAASYIFLTLLVGSGLCGHAILKQFWARPRPKQTMLFGGKYPYHPVWKPYLGDKDRYLRSLPSGHATMGFYFFALYRLGRRMQKRWLAITGLFTALLLGGLLSWVRMAQGGHFFSDITISCLIMWLSACFLEPILLKPQGSYVPDA